MLTRLKGKAAFLSCIACLLLGNTEGVFYPKSVWRRGTVQRDLVQFFNSRLGTCFTGCWVRTSCVATSYQPVARRCVLHLAADTQVTTTREAYMYSQKRDWTQDELTEICEREGRSVDDQCLKDSDSVRECGPFEAGTLTANGNMQTVGRRVKVTCESRSYFIATCISDGSWDTLRSWCLADRMANFALGKPATSSSRRSGSSVSAAVDGNESGNFFDHSCTHTNSSVPGPHFWQVDFGQIVHVARLVIYNRLDCCSERLNSLRIEVFSDQALSQDPQSLCTYYPGPPTDNPIILTCQKKIPGRYLKIVKEISTMEALALCEVEVYNN